MNRYKVQQGFTLVELLIALALSIVIILAMLRAFAITGKVTAESSVGAQLDGGLMLGLVATDRILQGIGFDVDSPKIQFFAGNEADASDWLIWNISAERCQALYNFKDKTKAKDDGLYLIGAETGFECEPESLARPTDVEGLSEVQSLIMINRALENAEIANTINKIGDLSLSLRALSASQKCLPFGVQYDVSQPGGKYEVVITANAYAGSVAEPKPLKNVTCLYNLR
jgi:prepilin-type N-terminal cleavage/methylation domain-containing protein